MKTNPKNMIVAIVAMMALTIAGCTEKEDTPQDQSPRCKITSLEETYTSGENGQTYTFHDSMTFQYDTNNRLIRFNEEDNDYQQFTYNSSGQLIKIEYFDEGVLEDYGDYTYSGNTVTLLYTYQDDEQGWVADDKEVYELNSSNQIVKIEYFNNDEGVWIKRGTIENTWQNGNVVVQSVYRSEQWKGEEKSFSKRLKQQRKHRTSATEIQNINFVKGDFIKVRTTTYTYDNKNNPFSSQVAFHFLDEDVMFNSKNNVITETDIRHQDNNETITYTYSYSYNEYDFPSSMDFSYSDEGYSSTTVRNFRYQCE